MITHVKSVVGGDHRVSMNHEAFGQRSSPENRSVVSVDAEQGVQHLILIRLVSDMAHCFEDSPSGNDSLLGHRTEFRIGDKLSLERTFDELVVRLRIVVRSVVRMTPVVDAVWNRLNELSFTNDRNPSRPQNSQHFRVGDQVGSRFRYENFIGQVFAEMDRRERPDVSRDSNCQQLSFFSGCPHRFHGGSVVRLEVDSAAIL